MHVARRCALARQMCYSLSRPFARLSSISFPQPSRPLLPSLPRFFVQLRTLSTNPELATNTPSTSSRLPSDGLTLKHFLQDPAKSHSQSHSHSDHATDSEAAKRPESDFKSYEFNSERDPLANTEGADHAVSTSANGHSEIRSEGSTATVDGIPVERSKKPQIKRQKPRTFYMETYGCQMNVNDSEIVHSILGEAGLSQTSDLSAADVILVNTCSIRDHAEQKIWQRLNVFKKLKQREKKANPPVVAVLGCMAERLKEKLIEAEKLVDIVAGPDAYRDLPRLLSVVEDGDTAVNVLLSLDETYADITPVRPAENQVSAYVSIMRGCDNMCSYCIVPRTRGRERSRNADSIVKEVELLSQQGFKEVILLGQNVNSYNFLPDGAKLSQSFDAASRGFVNISKRKQHEESVSFTRLLDRVSQVNPEMRIRFTSPHPKDFPDDLIQLISERPNLCKQLHLPAQSGSTSVLARMRRGYTREAYLDLISHVKAAMPNVALSSDFITGFCGETEADHQDTLSLMAQVQYDLAYTFKYSQRERTHAHRNYADDVPEDVKSRRLREMIEVFQEGARIRNLAEVGRQHLVVVEGESRKAAVDLNGRTDTNKRVFFPRGEVPDSAGVAAVPGLGEYVVVEVTAASSGSLRGRALRRTTLSEEARRSGLTIGAAADRKVDAGSEFVELRGSSGPACGVDGVNQFC